jgi:hypothetical protein
MNDELRMAIWQQLGAAIVLIGLARRAESFTKERR